MTEKEFKDQHPAKHLFTEIISFLIGAGIFCFPLSYFWNESFSSIFDWPSVKPLQMYFAFLFVIIFKRI
jgi:hypothetical protein